MDPVPKENIGLMIFRALMTYASRFNLLTMNIAYIRMFFLVTKSHHFLFFNSEYIECFDEGVRVLRTR